MQDVDTATLYLAIEIFKDQFGIRTPLDERIEEIIAKIKEDKKESK